jgi:cytochrome c-type biogenesis protein CcmF
VIGLGRAALILALVFSLASVVFLVYGVATRRRDLIRNGYGAVYASFLGVVVATTVLLNAFLSRDFSFKYVVENSHASLPAFYRVAGFWSGQEGSFLLWAFFLAVVTAVIALRDWREGDRVTGLAVAVLSLVTAFFLYVMVRDPGSNPFLKAEAGAAGMGLNPLLLHPAMVLHPPALFAGYAVLAVPFAFAASTLVLGRGDREWVLRSQKWAIGGWAVLTLGIGLGAWWAYVVLSWGGYWGWDPVENASLIPWLTATALIHSMNVYVRRGLLKRATVGLAAATFWLTILATWVTRTGVIESLHGYPGREYLKTQLDRFLFVVAVFAIVMMIVRWTRLRGDVPDERQTIRDYSYLALAVVFALLAFAVGLATVVVPVARDASVGAGTYQVIAQPLGVAVLVGLAACPLLRSGRRARILAAALVAVVVLLVAGLFGSVVHGRLALPEVGGMYDHVVGVVGLIAAALAASSVVYWMMSAARRGARAHGWARGLRRALTLSRPRTAGFVAHFGIVLVVAGLIGSNIYKVDRTAYIDAQPGAEAKVKDYTLRFVRYREGTGPQRSQRVYADFDVLKGGHRVGTLAPHTDFYDGPSGPAVRAVIRSGPFGDLFVVVQDPFDTSSKHLRLQLDIFPLIGFVWAGSILLVAGAAVGLWPQGRPELRAGGEAAASDPDDVQLDTLTGRDEEG